MSAVVFLMVIMCSLCQTPDDPYYACLSGREEVLTFENATVYCPAFLFRDARYDGKMWCGETTLVVPDVSPDTRTHRLFFVATREPIILGGTAVIDNAGDYVLGFCDDCTIKFRGCYIGYITARDFQVEIQEYTLPHLRYQSPLLPPPEYPAEAVDNPPVPVLSAETEVRISRNWRIAAVALVVVAFLLAEASESEGKQR